MRSTLTERDIMFATPLTANVSTSYVGWPPDQLPTRRQTRVDYLISEQSITDKPEQSRVSPSWLGRVKQRVKELSQLPANWDSYNALALDPRIPLLAESLIEWFAVFRMPPPDVFATNDGGIQVEWHIRRVDLEIVISPTDGTMIHFHDLNVGEQWEEPSSANRLHCVRRRLLAPV